MKRSQPPRRKTPLPRATKPIARGAPIARGTPPRKRNPERAAKNEARTMGPRARRKMVSRMPCAACGYAGPVPRQNCHIEVDGMGLKADYTKIIPLCTVFAVSTGALNCHGRQHGVNGGWMTIGMTEESRVRAAALTEEAWQAHLASRSGDSTDEDAA